MNAQSVVVVGAGPAGLATAVTLARAGVHVVVLERRSTGSPLPRATVLSLRSMELMRAWGLEERVLAAADDVDMTMLAMPSAARAAQGTPIDVGFPTAAQSSVLSPTRAVCIAQDLLESVLLEHASSLDVTVVRGCEVVDVICTDATTTAAVRDATGEVRWIDTQYVVGADGARSAVRTAMGIELQGPETLLQGVRVEFRAPLWDLLGQHRHLLYAITDPEATGVLLPAGRGDRWLFGVTYGAASDLAGPPTSDQLHQRLLRAVDLTDAQVHVSRVDRFTAGAQIATVFSRGTVFLTGDAAHRVTPRGGTGLNIAIGDGHDLGWKLGWVLRGWAPASLLDSYEVERRPAVQHNVHRSADPTGSQRSAISEIHVDLGGRLPHAWVGPKVSTLDVLGEGLTLLVADGTPDFAATAAPDLGPPLSVAAVDVLTAHSIGIGSHGAALLRPDGVPIATWWTTPSPAQLGAAASSMLTGPPHGDPAAAGLAA